MIKCCNCGCEFTKAKKSSYEEIYGVTCLFATSSYISVCVNCESENIVKNEELKEDDEE